MANSKSKDVTVVSKLFNPNTGKAIAVRSDRSILRKTPISSGWKIFGSLKDGVEINTFITKKKDEGFRELQRGDIPSFDDIRFWSFDGVSEATDGCVSVEPDGFCLHGCPAWTQVVLLG